MICIAGPTASGKSAAALAVAAAFSPTCAIEIVSVDSAQVYRGMDIGTAKPNAAERAAVPYHLIDIADPAERYSAARFADDARAAIAAITSRGALPLLVGGTMLYLRALFGGLAPMPAADAAVRAAIDSEAAEHGWPALHAQLAAVDPASAGRIAPHDSQRLQRALEVHRISGRTLTEWHADAPAVDALPMPTLIALEPRDRAWLHARIAHRFRAMLDEGLLDEVAALRARGDLDPALPSMRAVGYRQAWTALDAGDTSPVFDAAVAATRRLAKRQLTWLRAMPQRHVVACDDADATAQVVVLAQRLVAEARAP